MSKYIVSGGCGFIGSHLAESLLKLGHRVIVVDNLSTGFLSNLPEDDNLTVVKVDITNWDAFSKCFSYFQGSDGIFHLAACARIQPSIHQPHLTHDTNVTGTLHVLELARMCGIKSVVYSASSSYYGKEPPLPCSESLPEDCQTPYAIAKFMGELYCTTWNRLHGIKTVSLRYFNVYGRRSPLSGAYAPVIGLFFRQAFLDQPLTVVSDGEQRRDFTHVSDVVRANIMAMVTLNSDNWVTLSGNTLNIGTGKNHSINEIAKMVKTLSEKADKTPEIVHVPLRTGESVATLADIQRAKQVLKWEPEVDIEDGLFDLMNYFSNNVEKLKEGRMDF